MEVMQQTQSRAGGVAGSTRLFQSRAYWLAILCYFLTFFAYALPFDVYNDSISNNTPNPPLVTWTGYDHVFLRTLVSGGDVSRLVLTSFGPIVALVFIAGSVVLTLVALRRGPRFMYWPTVLAVFALGGTLLPTLWMVFGANYLEFLLSGMALGRPVTAALLIVAITCSVVCGHPGDELRVEASPDELQRWLIIAVGVSVVLAATLVYVLLRA